MRAAVDLGISYSALRNVPKKLVDMFWYRVILWICVPYVSVLDLLEHSSLRTEAPEKIQNHELPSKKETIWCAVLDDIEIWPYYSINGTVKRVEYYQMSDLYVRLEPHQFYHKSIPKEDGTLPYYKAAFISFCIKCFQIDIDYKILWNQSTTQVTILKLTWNFFLWLAKVK